MILCREIQSCSLSYVDVGRETAAAVGGGGRGRIDSGTHREYAKDSRRASEIFSTCLST